MDLEQIRLAKKAGIFRKSRVTNHILSTDTWASWEKYYSMIIDNNRTVQRMSPTKVLSGVTEPSGRITYNILKTKKEFGQLSYIIPELVNDENIEELPSLAAVLPGAGTDYLVLHPEEEDEDDIDMLHNIFKNIKQTGMPTYGLCILHTKPLEMAHGIAYIAWKDKKKMNHFAFYDPLSYRRKKTRSDGSIYYLDYDYGVNVLRWIQENADYKFTIHDLSDHCIRKNEEEYDCPQYQINAEYCYLYSLHFLYTWAHLGKQITEDGFRDAIIKSYIIPMDKLTRSYTAETLKYRVIMMSFIVTVFAKYFMLLTKEQKKLLPDYSAYKKHVSKIQDYWYEHYGISLVPIS